MMHAFVMAATRARLENLLGAMVLALSDDLGSAVSEACGHSGAVAAALTYLAQEPGISIQQLQGPLMRTQSATTRIVDRLVADGLAERRPGPDGRTIALHLTPAGVAAAHRVLKVRQDVLRFALGELDPDDHDSLTTLVEKILRTVTRNVMHGEQICRMCDLRACRRRDCPVDQTAVLAGAHDSSPGGPCDRSAPRVHAAASRE